MQTWQAHSEAVRSLAFSPEGRLLASVSDYTLRVRDLTTSKDGLRQVGSQFASSVSFSPDGRQVAWAGFSLVVWKIGQVNPITIQPAHMNQGCFTLDGKYYFAAGVNRGICRWETSAWQAVPDDMQSIVSGAADWLLPSGCIACHPLGRLLAVGFESRSGPRQVDSVVAMYDYQSSKHAASLRWRKYLRAPARLAFTPDGTKIAVAYGPRLHIWNVDDGVDIAILQPGGKHITDIAFTPNGRWLVTVSNDALVRFWDAEAWSAGASFEWQIGKLGAVAIAPDGLRMAAGGHTGRIVVWDVDE